MEITRRDFLRGMIVAAAAPAIVKASSLMPIWVPPERDIVIAQSLPPTQALDYLIALKNRLDEQGVPEGNRVALIARSNLGGCTAEQAGDIIGGRVIIGGSL